MIPLDGYLYPICVDDVTDDEALLREARLLVAESYMRLSSQGLSAQEVYDDLYGNRPHVEGRSSTFLARGYNPSTSRVETLGTVELVFGRPRSEVAPGMEPLDMMGLVEPLEGWERFNFDGCGFDRAAEISRFVLAPSVTRGAARAQGLPVYAFRRLIETCTLVAQLRGLNQTWCIMPPYVARASEAAGFEITRAFSIRLHLEENAGLFKKYDRYWIRNPPWLYRVVASPYVRMESSWSKNIPAASTAGRQFQDSAA